MGGEVTPGLGQPKFKVGDRVVHDRSDVRGVVIAVKTNLGEPDLHGRRYGYRIRCDVSQDARGEFPAIRHWMPGVYWELDPDGEAVAAWLTSDCLCRWGHEGEHRDCPEHLAEPVVGPIDARVSTVVYALSQRLHFNFDMDVIKSMAQEILAALDAEHPTLRPHDTVLTFQPDGSSRIDCRRCKTFLVAGTGYTAPRLNGFCPG